MASDTDKAATIEGEIRRQLDELRAQIATLVDEKVTPRIAEARKEAEDAIHRVGDAAGCQTATVAREIRERPFTAVLIAAAAGLLIGRLTR
ncbi:MAG: hypothetical protein BGP12_20475 [Rhodospirillales bacterium 70-18]|nr:hypothetical protein [Rhodospirillales bacterium]OJY67858.1 MAG: hypothetical protein BGP12_20475 [Rhodospirillales bacterium 70-18]